MKFFLDSAKLDEIDLAYNTFGIDGVTTNPRHVQNSGKPFKVVLRDISAWLKDHGLTSCEQFPVSVEINPHLSACRRHGARGQGLLRAEPLLRGQGAVHRAGHQPRRASSSAKASAPT